MREPLFNKRITMVLRESESEDAALNGQIKEMADYLKLLSSQGTLGLWIRMAALRQYHIDQSAGRFLPNFSVAEGSFFEKSAQEDADSENSVNGNEPIKQTTSKKTEPNATPKKQSSSEHEQLLEQRESMVGSKPLAGSEKTDVSAPIDLPPLNPPGSPDGGAVVRKRLRNDMKLM